MAYIFIQSLRITRQAVGVLAAVFAGGSEKNADGQTEEKNKVWLLPDFIVKNILNDKGELICNIIKAYVWSLFTLRIALKL
jgi:hypothetical protein